MKLSEKKFARMAEQALERLPPEIRDRLDNVVISVRRRPSPRMLREMGLPPDEPLLGVYEGYALTERSALDPPLFPAALTLFQGPIEEMCATPEEVEEQIELTIVHEIAHYFGIGEERLEELGYD
ncbi:MAG TPA: metallopeptidase family protein [bacterium]|nr:metallopeptidase family protein [bacterium]HPJ71576.1 metallopeptidase family protein [bacterium]HPQ67229.1 metallopeptidase family protein [bacterium]